MKLSLPIAAVALVVVGLLSGLPFRKAAKPIEVTAHLENVAKLETKRPLTTGHIAALRRTLARLSTTDGEELRRMYEREMDAWMKSSKSPGSLKSQVATRWAEVDPQGMLIHLMATGGVTRTKGGGGMIYSLYGNLFETWVQSDPQAAIEAAFEVFEHPEHSTTGPLRIVLKDLIESDPVLAVTTFAKHPDIVEATSFRDIVKTIDLFKGVNSIQARNDIIRTLSRKAARDSDSATAFLKWTSNQEPDLRAIAVSALFSSNAKQPFNEENLEHMQALLAEHPLYAEGFMDKFGASWAADDLSGALQWTDANLNGLQRHKAMSALLKGATESRFDDVVEVFDSLRPGSIRSATASVIARKLTADDPAEGLAWVESLESESEAYSEAIGVWANAWVKSDRAAAGAFVRDLPEGKISDQLIAEMTWNYAHSNGTPDDGFAWVRTLPREKALKAAESLIQGFTYNNWAAIEQFVINLEPGELRDGSLAELAKRTYFAMGKEEAIEWMRELNESDRMKALEGLRWRGDRELEELKEEF